jgi:hypothetical protein
MSHNNGCARSRYPAGAAVATLSLMSLVLTLASLAKGIPNKDPDSTRIYRHTYDEVFQAAPEAIKRSGLLVTDKDKDKGTINGTGIGGKLTFDMHIEVLSAKPETRVTINAKVKGMFMGSWGPIYTEKVLTELQQVLSPPPTKPAEVASNREQPTSATPGGKPPEPAPNADLQLLDAASSKALEDAPVGAMFHLNYSGQTLKPLPTEQGKMKGVPTAIQGYSIIGSASAVFLKIPGQHSELRVRAGRPAFIIKGDKPGVAKFYRFGVFRKDRETVVSQDINFAKGIANPGLGFTLAKFGDSAYEFVPELSLPAGEYGIQTRGGIFTFGVEHFGSEIDLTTDPKFLAIDHLIVLPLLDLREDQTEQVNLADLTNFTEDLLKQDNYPASLSDNKGTVDEILEANLADAKPEWIKRLGPPEARWVMVVGVRDTHGMTNSLEHTNTAEFVAFLFDKQDASVLWKGKGTGKVGRMLLGGVLRKGAMPGEAEKAALTDLLSGLPTLPKK